MADLGEQRSIIDNEITLDTFFYFFFSMIKISNDRFEIFVDNNSGIILEIYLYIWILCGSVPSSDKMSARVDAGRDFIRFSRYPRLCGHDYSVASMIVLYLTRRDFINPPSGFIDSFQRFSNLFARWIEIIIDAFTWRNS